MQHELKIFPEYYQEIVTGRIKFEIRQTDRDYKIGIHCIFVNLILKCYPTRLTGTIQVEFALSV